MAYDYIPTKLSNLFYRYGKFLSRHPLPFIVVPPLLSCVLLVGVLRINVVSDLEYLYATVDAPAIEERSYFKDTFLNDDNMYFTFDRHLKRQGFMYVYMEHKQSKRNMIESYTIDRDVLDAVTELNNQILTKQTKYNGKDYAFSDVCSKWFGECVFDNYTSLLAEMVNNGTSVTYPYHVGIDGKTYALNTYFGDARLDSNRTVIGAHSFIVSYHVRYEDDQDIKHSTAWLDELRDYLLDYKDPHIDVYFMTSLTVPQEIAGLVFQMAPLVAIMVTVTTVFSIGSVMVGSWVRSKPWVALSGLCSALFGVMSALGLMTAVGVPFVAVIGAMPFLIFGIGLDDMFILVSAWRHTSCRLRTEERMALTLKHAAVSVTITSVTDSLAFGVGCLAPLRSVRFFCAYTGVAVLFVYIYIITFTCAFLVYSGRREEANIPCYKCLCCTSGPKTYNRDARDSFDSRHRLQNNNQEKSPQPTEKYVDDASPNSSSGSFNNNADYNPHPPERIYEDYIKRQDKFGFYSHDSENKLNNNNEYGYKRHIQSSTSSTDDGLKRPWLTVFLGTSFADFLLKPAVKVVIVLLYLTGLGIAIWGCFNLERGTDPITLTPDNSYFHDFWNRLRNDFDEVTSPNVMVGFKDRLDYTDVSVRDDIDRFVDKLQSSKYFFEEDYYVSFWLWRFEDYLEETNRDINQLTMPQLIQILQAEFFRIPQLETFLVDVDINNSNTSIDNSRLVIKSKKIIGVKEDVALMDYVRDRAKRSSLDIEVFSSAFIFGDQDKSVFSTTMINLGIATGSILLVSLFFIPSITTAIWITLAVISISIYTIGFMVHWNVNLDSISMINLIQSVGFSVDFAAHISYHFVIDKSGDPRHATRTALGHLGTPIFQGALSTILSISILSTSISYIFRTFFKIVLMAMLFGFFHSVFLLPVLLSSLRCDFHCKKKSKKTKMSDKSESRLYVHKGSEREWLPEGAIFDIRNQMPFKSLKRPHNGSKTIPYDSFYHTNSNGFNGCYFYDNINSNPPYRNDPYAEGFPRSKQKKQKFPQGAYFSAYRDPPPKYELLRREERYTGDQYDSAMESLRDRYHSTRDERIASHDQYSKNYRTNDGMRKQSSYYRRSTTSSQDNRLPRADNMRLERQSTDY